MRREYPVVIEEKGITQLPPRPPPNAPVGAAWVDWQAFVVKVKCQDGTWAEIPMFRAEASLEG
jgi:hypothetical protein